MSAETTQWLSENTLIGFTAERGTAWHHRAGDNNHYEGAIPVEDVVRRLFNWKAVEGDITSTAITPDGVLTVKDPTRKAIIRPDTGTILGIFKDGYQGHDYEEWLLNNVSTLLDADLGISSAGLLKGGGVAWVEISVPDTIVLPEGVSFRPNILAGTSFDGSLSSTYASTVVNTVCDNTMSAALGESKKAGTQIKVKHSRYSNLKLTEARETLGIVHSIADDFAKQVSELTNVTVSDGDFAKFLDEIASTKKTDGSEKEGRSLTMASNKREGLERLWNYDHRVSPWKNTAYGVVQAVNTFVQHEGIVRGANRAERNALTAVTGGFDKLDAETYGTLSKVLA